MTFLCDTNVISELARPQPNLGVMGWSATVEIAQRSGELRGGLRTEGKTRSQADMLIAATA
jgi:predicted nucleic acid-binding protein